MQRHLYYYPLTIVIIAVLIGLFGWFTESSSMRWIAFAFGLALIAVGLGAYSFLLSLHTEKKTNELGAILERIEGMAEAMQKELNERSNSGSQVIPTLQAISQYFTESIPKQKEDDKQ